MDRFGWLAAVVFTLALLWTGATFSATGEQYLEEAEAYLAQGDLRAAVIQFKNALREDPDNAHARLRLGQTYLRLGDGAAAAKELERAQALGIAPGDVLVPLARAYLQQGQHQKVLNQISAPPGAAVDLQAEVLALHGQAELLQGRVPQAKERFDQAQELDANNVASLLGLARVAAVGKDFERAAGYATRAVELAPGEAEGWVVQGELARLQGQLAEAKDGFTHALEIDPNNLVARLARAATLVGLGEYPAAEEDVDAVVKRFPRHPLANYIKAVIAYQNKDLTAAETALKDVQRVAPDYLPGVLLLGAVFYGQGMHEQAHPLLKRYVDAAPTYLPARKLLAAIYLKVGQPREAIATLEAGQGEEDAQFLALMGSAYLQAGDPSTATDWFEKAVAAAPDLAALRTQLAISHLYEGETAQAVTELQSAVDLGQGPLQSDILLVIAHLRNRDLDQALTAGRALVNKLPDSPISHNLLGGVHLARGDVDLARQQFQQALALKPDYSAAAINLARLDVKVGKIVDAESRLKSILEYNERDVGAMMGLAELATRQGRVDDALRWLELAWAKNPGALQPGLALAKYYGKQGEHLKAIAIARELRNTHPKNPQPLQVLGTARLAMGEPASAVDSFRQAVALQPQSAEAYWMLANAQTAAEDFQGAIDSLEKALSVRADFLPAKTALVRLKQRTGRLQEALQIARDIQARYPQNSQGYLLEGDVRMAAKDYTGAAASYANGFSHRQTAELAIRLFRARRQLGDAESAREPLVQWIATHPDDAAVRQVLGQAYLEAAQTERAIEQYRAVVSAQPNNVLALNNLAWLLHQRNDPTAVEYAQQAYDLAPERPEIADTLGWLLLAEDDAGRGLKLLQEAATKAPQLPSIRYHLAVALAANDRQDEARKELERLLRDDRDFPELSEAQALFERLQGH